MNTNRPDARSPCIRTMTSRAFHFSVSYVPASQIVIDPPPYSPFGISPENSRYSMGWSSVRTASRTVAGSVGRPLGTAQEASTPSRSRRTSQCSRRAWCSWMTKRCPSPGPAGSLSGTGSGVRRGSRLRRYSSSGTQKG
jgi:hypothetical protein